MFYIVAYIKLISPSEICCFGIFLIDINVNVYKTQIFENSELVVHLFGTNMGPSHMGGFEPVDV